MRTGAANLPLDCRLARYVDINIIELCQRLQDLLLRPAFWSATLASVFMSSELQGRWHGASMMLSVHSA